jgi:hypothetical protein
MEFLLSVESYELGGEISWVRNHGKHRVDMMRQDIQVGTQEGLPVDTVPGTSCPPMRSS